MRYHKIPDETVRRLPVYLRGLLSLSQESVVNISSEKLAAYLGVNSWQIRKDFSYFGSFGKRGIGYNISNLIGQIKKILRLNVTNRAALVGFGNLGAAVFAYHGFANFNFEIAAVFDRDKKKIGKKISGLIVEDISKLGSLKRRGIHFAILVVPENAAQEMADSLVEAGIKGILNFSPSHIKVPKKVKVVSIDISMDLACLPYYATGS